MKKFIRFLSSAVIVSLIASNLTVGNFAQADTICIPTVTSSTSLGITNFTLGGINNTTPTPSGQGGVVYHDYTGNFAPELVTKGDTVNFSLSFAPTSAYFGIYAWAGINQYNAASVSGNAISSPVSSSLVIPNYPTGIITLRAAVSTAMLDNPQLCSSPEGEYEDYSLLVQGAAPAVNFLPTNGSTFVREGGRTDTFGLQLDTKPTANVTITLTPDSRFTLSNTSFTFTPANWYIHQNVTVTAVDDGIANGQADQQVSYSTSSSDGAYDGLTGSPLSVQVIDNDSADDSSIEINIFSTSTDNNTGGDVPPVYPKVSGITSFGEFGGDNFFGPTDSSDISTPTARRYNYFNGGMTSPLKTDFTPTLTTLSSPTVLALDDDALTDDITLPFDVMLYGRAMRHIKIGSNGIIYLSPTAVQSTNLGNENPYVGTSALDLSNISASSTFSPNGEVMIAALWSDLSPASAGGSGTISYGVEGTAPNQQFIVYYDSVAPFSGTGGVNTVQVKLIESAVNPTGDVNVTANIDPTISFTLTSNNCGLGSLSTSLVKTCSFDVAVQTNATGGYTASIKDANNGALISGSNSISSQSVTLGSGGGETHEGFGITSSSASGDVVNNATCSDEASRIVTGITDTNQSVAVGNGPTLSDSTTVCVGAIISDLTPAGSYTDTAIVTVVGNF